MSVEAVYNFFQKSSEYFNLFIDVCKEAWNQPHAPLYFITAGVLFVLIIVIHKIRHYKQPIKLFNNRAGEVEVTRKALDELVQSVCYGLGALNRPKVKIYTRRGRLCMTVSLKVESGQKLTDAAGEIQQALTTAFREHMGVEKLGKIDVKIIGFRGLVYKPTEKFLPPIKDDNETILDKESPVIDIIDTSSKS